MSRFGHPDALLRRVYGSGNRPTDTLQRERPANPEERIAQLEEQVDMLSSDIEWLVQEIKTMRAGYWRWESALPSVDPHPFAECGATECYRSQP